MQEPLSQRRGVLAELLTEIDAPALMFSEGTAELGRSFFERMVADGHEGVMAKLQTSRYLPGRRSTAWKKIKPTEMLPCVIIGYTSCRDGIHSLLVASVHQGPLRYVGQITSGFSDRMKNDLERRLSQRRRPRPVVACPRQALWVEPDLTANS